MEQNEHKAQPIQDNILGTRTDNSQLFLVFWERMANSGRILLWADNEEEAISRIPYSPKFCKFLMTKINPEDMPIEWGNAR